MKKEIPAAYHVSWENSSLEQLSCLSTFPLFHRPQNFFTKLQLTWPPLPPLASRNRRIPPNAPHAWLANPDLESILPATRDDAIHPDSANPRPVHPRGISGVRGPALSGGGGARRKGRGCGISGEFLFLLFERGGGVFVVVYESGAVDAFTNTLFL